MKRLITTLCALAMALAPSLALAHPDHGGHGFVTGLVHPLTGTDHLAAMLLVGLGAAIFEQRGGWKLPVAFLVGAALGFVTCAWVPVGLAEGGIVASLVVLGLAITLRLKSSTPLLILAVAAFGYAHGASHGIETPEGAMPALFAAAFLVTSAALHLGGYALARVLPVPALRLIGAGGAGMGVVLAGLS